MKRSFIAVTAFTLVAVSAHRSPAQATPEQVQRADSIFARFSKGDSPGASVAVVKDGKVLFAKGYGLADLEHHIPNTPSTVFDIASVSKQFAGLSVAMLITEGKISLKDDIRKYIPELQVMTTPITVENLLHHTSGMRDWPGTLAVAGWRFDDVISFSQILTMAYHQKTLNFVPGAEYTYSNTGFNLLAEMVQRVSGQSFRAFTNERIFRPLGMNSSVFRDDHTLVVPQRAFGYSRGADSSWHFVTNNLTALGSSSLMSSVDDMARWLMNFDDKRVGGEKAHALARTRGTLNDGSSIPYAFGIVNGDYRGVPTLNHSGSWAAFVSFLVQFPQQHAGVVVLANTPGVNTGRAAYALADIFLGESLGPVAAVAAPGSPPSLSTATLDRYTGVYRLGPGWYTRISRNGDSLSSLVPGEAAATMTPRPQGEFWIANYNSSMTFAPLPAAPQASAPYLTYRGKRADRVDAHGLRAPTSLAPFAGTYVSDELGIEYPIEVKGTTLVLRTRQQGDVTLTHRWRDDFSGEGFFRSVAFTRNSAGRVTGLLVNVDERSRDIRFARR